MNFYIASDHAGFLLKKKIIEKLNTLQFNDLGCFSSDSVDYPDYANKLCNCIDENSFGILICGTGIGISIAANRYKHIRCALLYNTRCATLAKQHNNINVIALGAKETTLEESIDIINTVLNTNFEYGRHLNRINKL